jgi:hypothetical protein
MFDGIAWAEKTYVNSIAMPMRGFGRNHPTIDSHATPFQRARRCHLE